MRTTRHYDASRPTGPADADEIARLALWHQLPARGQADSTDRMLDTAQAIINGTGTGYELNKIRDWIRRFPLRVTAERTEDWPDWASERIEEIALQVLMHGAGVNVTAIRYGTTAETVDAIIAAFKLRNRRSRN